MASPLERDFTTSFRKSLEAAGAAVHKIADAPHFQGSKARFDKPKPFDGFAGWRGIPIVFEAKAIREFSSFGPGLLRPCQVEGLTTWEAAGFTAMVILNVRVSARENWMLWWPWAKLQGIWHVQGSIKKIELEAMTLSARQCSVVTRSRVQEPGKAAKYIDRYEVTRFLHDAERVYWDLAEMRRTIENPPF